MVHAYSWPGNASCCFTRFWFWSQLLSVGIWYLEMRRKTKERSQKRKARGSKVKASLFWDWQTFVNMYWSKRKAIFRGEDVHFKSSGETWRKPLFKQALVLVFIFFGRGRGHFNKIHQLARAPTNLVPDSPLIYVPFCFYYQHQSRLLPLCLKLVAVLVLKGQNKYKEKKTNPKLCQKSISVTSTESIKWQFLDMFWLVTSQHDF